MAVKANIRPNFAPPLHYTLNIVDCLLQLLRSKNRSNIIRADKSIDPLVNSHIIPQTAIRSLKLITDLHLRSMRQYRK